MPEVISFDRVAPLLDAILADVTAMQIKQLQMSATDANATNLDAIQESLQVTASYNQLDGLVNSKNADLLKANSDLQLKTTSQLSSALDQYKTALDSVNSAQQLVNTLSAQVAADSNDKTAADNLTAANSALTSANNNATTIATELATLKSSQSTLTVPTFTSSSPAAGADAAGGSTTLASKLLPSGISAAPPSIASAGGSGTSGTPSLPPTKQMDTQIGLIWDRAMRILSTLGQPDSKRGWKFVLLRFYPSVTQADKKTDGIKLTYAVGCDLPDVDQPVVMDVYPRIAPVNILGEKIRDRSWNLAAVLGFPGTNATVNYNREHLKLSNSLGQSSFLTGFGAGTSEFGWTIGKTFGDDTIAPGQRETYALVAVPPGCMTSQGQQDGSMLYQSHFKVYLKDITWLGSKGPLAITPSYLSKNYWFDYGASSRSGIQLSYSQTAVGSPAPLTFTLDQSIDPEARVLVNGQVLKRARDGFGQGTVSGTKAGSTLFEGSPTDFSATGSWTRISEHEITLLLDPKTYSTELPLITLSSPSGSLELTHNLKHLTLNGVKVSGESLKGAMPGLLALDSSATHTGKALRWQAGAKPGSDDKILISLDSDVIAATGSSNQTETQTVASTQAHFWGATPLVIARHGDSQEILNDCDSQGLLLQCRINWKDRDLQASNWSEDLKKAWTLTVYDLSHGSGSATAPVAAQLHLARPQPADRRPLFIIAVEPDFESENQLWRFKYPVISTYSPNLHINLERINGNQTHIPINHTCATGACEISFVVTPEQSYELTDDMNFRFSFEDGPLQPTEVVGLHSKLEPTLDAEPQEGQPLQGKNLCFRNTQIAFGKHGPTVDVDCVDSSDITLSSTPKVSGPVTVYLLDKDRASTRGDAAYHPIWITTAQGRKLWTYTPPAAVKGANPKGGNQVDTTAQKGTPTPSGTAQPRSSYVIKQ